MRASKETRRQAQEVAQLYEAALTNVVVVALHKARSVLVLSEDLRFAPDLLKYFATAGAAAPRGPYLVRHHGVERQWAGPLCRKFHSSAVISWFGGIAWLILHNELLREWPASDWKQLFRSNRLHKQFFIPELSRAKGGVSRAVSVLSVWWTSGT